VSTPSLEASPTQLGTHEHPNGWSCVGGSRARRLRMISHRRTESLAFTSSLGASEATSIASSALAPGLGISKLAQSDGEVRCASGSRRISPGVPPSGCCVWYPQRGTLGDYPMSPTTLVGGIAMYRPGRRHLSADCLQFLTLKRI
jgi:hypothetical protein